jgi:hypothetical protein
LNVTFETVGELVTIKLKDVVSVSVEMSIPLARAVIDHLRVAVEEAEANRERSNRIVVEDKGEVKP